MWPVLKSRGHRMHHILRFRPVHSSLQHSDRLTFTSRLNLTLPSSFCTAFPPLALAPHRREIKVYLFQSKAISRCGW